MVLFTGNTVEEAIEKGLAELKISRLKAHIKVVSREKKGFFGFGKKPAQVDIEGIIPASLQAQKEAQEKVIQSQKTEPTPTPEVAVVIEEESQAQDQSEVLVTEVPAEPVVILEEESPETDSFDDFVAKEFTSPEPAKSADAEEAAQQVLAYLTQIIYDMDLEASYEVSHNRRHINIQIETPEPGRMIGYHGKVLKSLQLLAQNFLHDRYSKSFSVSLNVHDYVEHRMETLIDFTEKIAHRVLETGQDYIMDAMSNTERKIVHKTVSRIGGVESYSEGNDPNRHVVVTLRG